MNLDDRMRSAHKRQLDDISNQTRASTFTPRPTPVLQRAAPVLGVAAMAIIAFFGVRALVDDGPTSIEFADSVELDAEAPESPEPSIAGVPVDESTTTTTAPDLITTTSAETSTIPPEDVERQEDALVEEPGADDTVAEAPGEAQDPVQPEETVVPETTTSEPPVETSTTTTVVVDPGLPSVKCPSGLRAPLELGSLRYVGPNVGWNRLDDLVDEQDNEFEFEAWEPGYPDEVTVEVTLNQTVDAVDIRVAQDPFTPVSGDIEISTFFDGNVVETFLLPLSGVDGWVVNEFATTARIDQFTITRNGVSENIMEVIVCVQ